MKKILKFSNAAAALLAVVTLLPEITPLKFWIFCDLEK